MIDDEDASGVEEKKKVIKEMGEELKKLRLKKG